MLIVVRVVVALLAIGGLGIVAESVMARWDQLTPETRNKGFSIIPLLFAVAFGVVYAAIAALPFNLGLYLTLPALLFLDGVWGFYLARNHRSNP